MTTSRESSGAPEGYRSPLVVWMVEAVHPAEPDRAHAVLQLGAFDSEAQAQRLLGSAPVRYPWAVEFRINSVPVHHTLEDWEYDR